MLREPAQQPAPRVRSIAGAVAWSYTGMNGSSRGGAGPFAVAAGAGFVRQAAAAMSSSGSGHGLAAAGAGDQTPTPLDYAGYAAVVRSAVEDHDRGVGVKPLEQAGRTVWRAAMRLDGNVVELVVDQQTGITQWFTAQRDTASGLPRQEFEVKRIRYDESGRPSAGNAAPASAGSAGAGATPSAAATGSVPLWTAAPVAGMRFFASLPAAGRAAGFTPVVSTLAPDGYELAAAGVTSDTPPLELEAAPPRPVRRLELLYVRDLSSFTVTELAVGAGDAGWIAAASRKAAGELSPERSPVQYGLFSGTTAQTWFSAGGPALLISGGGYLVVVRGGLTRAELLDLAQGFEQFT